ncbi:MAG TPA: hypothetical protein DCL15_08255, partial [Chloroflexi bacterium]|nr:hypothetical protein [Chloroflexota bacterium]HHW85280.1 tetratricopeptide repeat protein [Chloroflexota bacterium]
MTSSLLPNLLLTPAQVATLPAVQQRRVLHFLLRWEACADVLACLEQMAQPPGDVVWLRAQALLGLGRITEAQQMLQTQLQKQHDPTLALLLAEV